MKLGAHARRLLLEVLGWLLVVAGVAALVLPGPGLLCLVAGLALLSQQYEWAERRLRPLEVMAYRAAAEAVQSWWRIAVSCAGALLLGAVGVLWCVQPDVPGWWPVADRWWLAGGWGTGVSLIGSALFALGFIGYSVKRFRGVEDPDAEAERQAAA